MLELICKTGENSKLSKTLLSTLMKFSAASDHPHSNATKYHQVVGMLLHLTIIRLDVCFIGHQVCQFMQHPFGHHWVTCEKDIALKKCLVMVFPLVPLNTLQFKFSLIQIGHTGDDQWSTGANAIFFEYNLFSWQSNKQHIVA